MRQKAAGCECLNGTYMKTTSEWPQSGPVIPLSSELRTSKQIDISKGRISFQEPETVGRNRVEPRRIFAPYAEMRKGRFLSYRKLRSLYDKSTPRECAKAFEAQIKAETKLKEEKTYL